MKVCTTCGNEYPDDQSFCPTDGTALRAADGSGDLIGTVVANRYRILSKLGEGGMGTVYLGEHVKMGRKSAIKVISRQLAQEADAVARFNREAANAARINHPNVCGIYDFGETEAGLIYLAMEFIEGEALTDLITREGRLAPKRAGAILAQAADALEAAHELSIVHRDLKPDNIMIGRGRDDGDIVKVVDFGIAKAVGGDDDQKVTRTGLVVGTPEYMSPEQLSGDAVDGRSDIYSLALVFFRTLTGTLPFQADTAQEVMIKRLTDEPLKLNQALPGGNFPPELQEVMDRALQRMPSDRYASAAQFGRDAVVAVGKMIDVPIPPVDSDGATQMMDAGPPPPTAAGADTAPLPGTRTSGAAPTITPDTPVPPGKPSRAAGRRRRAPAGVVAATLGALALGTGGAVLWNGVIRDTEQGADGGNGRPPVPLSPDSGSRDAERGERDSDAGAGDRDSVKDAGPTNPAWMDLSQARKHLLDLAAAAFVEEDGAVLRAVRDTALAYWEALANWEAAGLAEKDRADAAYVAANAFKGLGDRPNARTWIQHAMQIDANDPSYQALATELGEGGNLE